MSDLSVMSPYIQFGFAGFAFLLLVVVVWMVRNLLKVIRESNTVISGNTAVIAAVHESTNETKLVVIEVKDKLLSNPCMLPEEIKEEIRPIVQKYRQTQAAMS